MSGDRRLNKNSTFKKKQCLVLPSTSVIAILQVQDPDFGIAFGLKSPKKREKSK